MSLRTAMAALWSVGDLRVNVSSGRMSLRTATTKTRENLKAILYVFADCKHEADREDAKSIRMRKMKRSGVVHRKSDKHSHCMLLRSAHVEKKRFFKMGIVETCHTHKFYRHSFFWFLYFTFLKLPPPPRAAILVYYIYLSWDHKGAKLQGMCI